MLSVWSAAEEQVVCADVDSTAVSEGRYRVAGADGTAIDS